MKNFNNNNDATVSTAEYKGFVLMYNEDLLDPTVLVGSISDDADNIVDDEFVCDTSIYGDVEEAFHQFVDELLADERADEDARSEEITEAMEYGLIDKAEVTRVISDNSLRNWGEYTIGCFQYGGMTCLVKYYRRYGSAPTKYDSFEGCIVGLKKSIKFSASTIAELEGRFKVLVSELSYSADERDEAEEAIAYITSF